MFRGIIIELLIMFVVIMVARAVLTRLFQSIKVASRNAYQQTMDESQRRQEAADAAQNVGSTGQLYKDPVCGTYVAGSTPFRRQVSGNTFYYCSDSCRVSHTPVAR